MSTRAGLFLAAATAALLPAWDAAAAPEVVVSIKPIHSLVAGVMLGVGEPELLVTGAGSPHSYSLRPSQARALSDADLVVWVGPELETFLQRPIDGIAEKATVLELGSTEGIELLDYREGGAWEPDVHDDHGDHDHDEHAKDEHDHDHDHDEHAKDEHGHDEHDHDEHAKDEHDHDHDEHDHDEHAKDEHDHDHDHDEHAKDEHDHDEHAKDEHDHAEHAHGEHVHGEHDLHIWLDPHNAEAVVEATVAALSRIDPDQAEVYAGNGKAVVAELAALDADLRAALAGIKDRPYIVFHDAYQYFEAHYGLNAVGSITVSPERAPGAKRLSEIREKITDLGATCVFSEPQFEPALVETVIDGTSARTGVLDPLGAEVDAGAGAYAEILRGLASGLTGCLKPAS